MSPPGCVTHEQGQQLKARRCLDRGDLEAACFLSITSPVLPSLTSADWLHWAWLCRQAWTRPSDPQPRRFWEACLMRVIIILDFKHTDRWQGSWSRTTVPTGAVRGRQGGCWLSTDPPTRPLPASGREHSLQCWGPGSSLLTMGLSSACHLPQVVFLNH